MTVRSTLLGLHTQAVKLGRTDLADLCTRALRGDDNGAGAKVQQLWKSGEFVDAPTTDVPVEGNPT